MFIAERTMEKGWALINIVYYQKVISLWEVFGEFMFREAAVDWIISHFRDSYSSNLYESKALMAELMDL